MMRTRLEWAIAAIVCFDSSLFERECSERVGKRVYIVKGLARRSFFVPSVCFGYF